MSIKYLNPESQISRSSIEETFTGKNITKFEGAGLLRRHFKNLGLWEHIEKGLSYKVRSSREFCICEMLTALIYGLTLGFHRPSQMMELVFDKVFQRLAALRAFPVQSTISWFLSRVSRRVSRNLHGVGLDLLISVLQGFSSFNGLRLDLDSHVSVVYEAQQRAKRGITPRSLVVVVITRFRALF